MHMQNTMHNNLLLEVASILLCMYVRHGSHELHHSRSTVLVVSMNTTTRVHVYVHNIYYVYIIYYRTRIY